MGVGMHPSRASDVRPAAFSVLGIMFEVGSNLLTKSEMDIISLEDASTAALDTRGNQFFCGRRKEIRR